MERTIPHFDGEGAERYVCELSGDNGRCGLIFTSWTRFIAHQTHNKGGNHGIKAPLRVAVTTNQRVNCWQCIRRSSHAESRRQLVDQRHLQDRSQSHDLVTGGTQPISCNLCAQDLGDLRTYYAHARLTQVPFPAPASMSSVSDRQDARQQSSDGHEREPTVHQEGLRGRRGAATPKAAPTAEPSKTEEPLDDSGGQAQSRQQGRRTRRCETYHRRCGTLC